MRAQADERPETKQSQNQKELNMTPSKALSPASHDPGFTKSTPVPAIKIGAPKLVRTDKAAPSRAEIEAKAHEIWMAQGQPHGLDQKHWFEAERQLRQG